MRIGIVAPPWVPVPPPEYGGTELVIDELARGFVARGHDVRLFTTGDATCPVPRLWYHDRAVGTTGSWTDELVHVEVGYRALRSFDIVHDHTLVGPVVAGMPDHAHLPVVTTAHGQFTPEMREHFRLVSRRATIVAISRAQRREVLDLPASVIHHGIDTTTRRVGAGDGGYVVFLGRMAADKGVHLAIDAARRAEVPIIVAAKMWEPAERDYFEQMVRPRLTADAEYVGMVSGDTKAELLGGAVALVNPICWPEPFGLVMIEAMAHGTPVVAFAEGSAPEIVDHGRTGFLSHDVRQMAHHIRLASSLDRSACRAAVEHRFSADRMVEDHLDLYRRVLLRHRTVRAAAPSPTDHASGGSDPAGEELASVN